MKSSKSSFGAYFGALLMLVVTSAPMSIDAAIYILPTGDCTVEELNAFVKEKLAGMRKMKGSLREMAELGELRFQSDERTFLNDLEGNYQQLGEFRRMHPFIFPGDLYLAPVPGGTIGDACVFLRTHIIGESGEFETKMIPCLSLDDIFDCEDCLYKQVPAGTLDSYMACLRHRIKGGKDVPFSKTEWEKVREIVDSSRRAVEYGNKYKAEHLDPIMEKVRREERYGALKDGLKVAQVVLKLTAGVFSAFSI